jgi:adenylate cyclase
LVKTTGDGLLIEFGSVVDALRCAVEVEQEMARRNSGVVEAERIEFRIGIHQGDIVIESGDILGDGVNVAARLEGLAEPGGICVSARVQEDVAGKLDLIFDDLGEQALKNIARPIRVFRILLRVVASPFIAITTGNTLAWTLPDKPSIAVLPFTNMSNDPEQEYFGDGIAEDIITALSHYPSLFVIARNSSFTYKGRAVSVREVGRDLGVRYVLEGSLRKSANRVRVTGQLVEAATGNHVWAERYDRDLADIFAVQDEITDAVTVAIAPAIAEAEQQRALRKPPGSLDAWAAYQRGLWHLGKVTVEDFAVAQELFERGIQADPTFAGCYTGLALARLQASAIYQSLDANEAQRSAEALARRAVACDSGDAEARSCLGWAVQARGELEGALIEIDRALEISPNLAVAHAQRGATLIFIGRPKEGIGAIETSIRLDPRDPFSAIRLLHIACGLIFPVNTKKPSKQRNA